MIDERKFLPPALPEVIPRTRLLEQLDRLQQKRLIIVHAPAGQGKTTFLTQYLALRQHRVAWHNLTEEDSDPARFLSLLARAIGSIFPGQDIESLRTPMQTSLPLDEDVALRHWFSHFRRMIPGACWVVLDDYHRLARDSAVHKAVEVLLEEMPADLTLVIISRTPPPLSIASQVAKRQVTELTTQDLALSKEETDQLAELLLRRPLTAAESNSLWKSCEGWIAGVILMIHAFSQQTPSPGALGESLLPKMIGKIPGRELLFDYLAREVFERLPPATQNLLCRTSMLESVPVSLARVLSGNPRARSILSSLKRDNLLTSVLDAEGSVYRYHPLFREFLRERFSASLSSRHKQTIYRTSAVYYEQQGNSEEAVRLCLEAGLFHQAVHLIESSGLKLIRLGKKKTLLDWIQALPARVKGANPRLIFYQGLASIVEDPAGSKKLLARALMGFRRRKDLAGQVLGVGTLIEIHTLLRAEFGRIPPLVRLANRLLHRLDRTKAGPGLRAFLLRQLGLSNYLVLGRFQEARSFLEESLKTGRQVEDVAEQVRTLTYLTWCTCYAEDLGTSRKYLEQALMLLSQREFKQEWEPMAWMAKAVVNSFEANFKEGLEAMAQAERLTAELGTTSVHPYNLTVKGFLLMEAGQLDEARLGFESCRRMAEQIRYRWFEFLSGMFLTKLNLISGDLAAASYEARRMLRLGEAAGGRFFYSWGMVLAGMAEIERGDFRPARKLLMRALSTAREMKTALLEATVRLALARLDFELGTVEQGRALLQEGMNYCADHQSYFYPLWYPSFIVRTCRDALRYNIRPDFAAKLLVTRVPQEALHVLAELIDGPDPEAQVRGIQALAGVKSAESEKMLREAVRSTNVAVRQAAQEGLMQHQRDILPRLSIHTLGSFRVYRGEEFIPDRVWQGKRMKDVLKVLAALGGSKVSQEAVMETLWPGNNPAASAANLRSLVSRLRRILEPEMEIGLESIYLHTKEGLLSLDQGRCWVDVKEFRARLEEGNRLERELRTTEALAVYLEAESLYRGDFLEEDRTEDWVLPYREQLTSAYLGLLHRIARLKESHEAREEVPAWYRKILARNPLDEEASRGLMRSLHRIGQRAEALRAYEECRERLISELGVEPMEETTALYRQVREQGSPSV